MKRPKNLINTIKLLRFQFSVFLLPVSLFSLYYIRPVFDFKLLLLLFVWHFLVFPASNGYNSYHDKDEGPIGGLAAPPRPTKALLYCAFFLDGFAILLALFINVYFAFFVFVYITASRLYSNRTIRLKKYPVYGFLVVFIFQGIWVFCGNVIALSSINLFSNPAVVYAAITSSFFIGTIYPLTQIYQHQADRADNIRTLSMVLGIKNTFKFSAIMFATATLFIYLSFEQDRSIVNFWLFILVMVPSLVYFIMWALKSFRSHRHVNFKNTMIMVILSSVLNNIYFMVLLLK